MARTDRNEALAAALDGREPERSDSSSSKPSQKADRAEKAEREDANTYYLVPIDELQKRMAERYRRDRGFPPIEQGGPRFVTELKFARLDQRHRVRVLYLPDGSGDLVASAPVSAGDHWRSGGVLEEGGVNARSFVSAVAKGCLPAVCKVRKDSDDDPGTLRIAYA